MAPPANSLKQTPRPPARKSILIGTAAQAIFVTLSCCYVSFHRALRPLTDSGYSPLLERVTGVCCLDVPLRIRYSKRTLLCALASMAGSVERERRRWNERIDW
jgi:hypothetical protein